MLSLLMYAFPTMLLIVAIYLWLFKESLQTLLKLDQPKIIKAYCGAFITMALLGFILNILGYQMLLIIWMVLSLILVGLLTMLLYQAVK